jgi:phospholipid/cholesterol/gamma-HCH transport system substrate-binding protein
VKSTVELRVGLLVILAIVATTTWLLFLKEFKFSVATFPIQVEFTQVAGLKPGAPVEILGVNRGKVRSVDLMQDHVRVTLEIEQGTFVGEDARALLVTDLFDPASVRIVPGRSTTALAPGASLSGSNNTDLAVMMSEGAELVSSLSALAARLDSLSGGGRLDSLAANVEGGVRELRAWTAESRVQTRAVLTRVDGLTANLDRFLDENAEPVSRTVADLGQAALRADTLATDLSQLARSLARISEGLEAGEGSLGKAIASPALHDSLMQTVARLDSLVAAIMANPKKFISFSLF